jgi:hypothetical protein
MRRDEIQQALGEVRAVYAELAKRPLERNCQARTECCQFQLTGRTPYLTKGEALVAAIAFRATGRKDFPKSAAGTCPFLKLETGRCLIYADRARTLAKKSSTSSAGSKKWTANSAAMARARLKPQSPRRWKQYAERPRSFNWHFAPLTIGAADSQTANCTLFAACNAGCALVVPMRNKIKLRKGEFSL